MSPFLLRVLAISWTMVSSETRGRPRQLMEIRLNIRCSILFHLLVSGGKCIAEIASPVSLAVGRAKRHLKHLEPRYRDLRGVFVLRGFHFLGAQGKECGVNENPNETEPPFAFACILTKIRHEDHA